MIAFLKGTLLQKTASFIILENQGVGYKIFTTPDILEKRAGEEVSLFTYHKSGDDGQALFGLPDFSSLQFFELLITVSGVGPKMALAILSAAPAESVKQAILSQDAGIFTRISGVGTKTAEKIIVELKGKMGALSGTQPAASSEVFDALLALGYRQSEARSVIGKLDPGAPAGEQIKQALKLLGK